MVDIYFAVFNVRKSEVNKARVAFNKKFGKGSYAKHISPFIRAGIMSIFNKPPTEQTKWYVEYLARLVNERAEKRG